MSKAAIPASVHTPTLAVDAVIFVVANNALTVLLVKREWDPYKHSWSLPGGFVPRGEDAAHAAEGILLAKAGMHRAYMEQLYTFTAPKRDPRGHVASVVYMAMIPEAKFLLKKRANVQETQLCPVTALPKLAFDHRRIVKYALERLRAKLSYTNVAFALLPNEFTLTELRHVYELILGRKLDKRNFIKKFTSLGIIKQTTKKRTGARQRPARLYRFVSREPVELEKFFAAK